MVDRCFYVNNEVMRVFSLKRKILKSSEAIFGENYVRAEIKK